MRYYGILQDIQEAVDLMQLIRETDKRQTFEGIELIWEGSDHDIL